MLERGERLPLTFSDVPMYREFQSELRAVFVSEGITDASVHQIGAATTGWETDPNKPLAPWTTLMAAEFVVFSRQSLIQAMHLDVRADRTLVWQGQYVLLLSEAEGQLAFYDTSVGRKLAALASRWSERLHEQAAQGFSFRLCFSDRLLAEGPFMYTIDVMGDE
jgi:hypothetical protein